MEDGRESETEMEREIRLNGRRERERGRQRWEGRRESIITIKRQVVHNNIGHHICALFTFS